MMRWNRQPGSAGFTLLEILVAMVLFSVVMTTLFGTFRAFLRSGEDIRETLDRIETFRPAADRISRDLESVFILQPPRYAKPEFDSDPDPFRLVGFEQSLGQGQVSVLSFTSTASVLLSPGDQPGIARISYYATENGDGAFDLYRLQVPWMTAADPAGEIGACGGQLLCRGITGFEIEYLDLDGEAHKSWDSDDEDTGFSTPVRVLFRLRQGRENSSRLFAFTVNLMQQREPM